MVGANKTTLDNQPKHAGYCWFTTADGKLYIDWESEKDTTDPNKIFRAVLNAEKADKDSDGNTINSTYAKKTELNAYAPASHASSATTYGVSTSSNYGHAKASSTTPKANGTAAVGSETSSFARGDHVHPLQTSVANATNATNATKATQDASGNIITSTYATKTELNGRAPANHASSATTYGIGDTANYGHLKVGSNISVTNGVISLSKANVTAALGYTPPTKDTTYSTATSSALGLVKIGYTQSGKNYPVQLSNGQMYVNVPWTNTTYTLSSFGITSTATELNYCDGVTSNIQTQLNNKSEYFSNITIGSSQDAVYYGRICKILLPNGYSDLYLEFDLNGRSDRHQKVKIWVQKSNTTEISGKSIYYSGPKGNCYEVAGYHYIDSTNGDYFEVWCKVPSWDCLNIQKKTVSGNYGNPANSITWYYSKNTALPTTGSTVVKYTAIAETLSGSIAWNNISSKPSTFTPATHTHKAGDITSGTLALARGGTGITSNPSMLVNLSSTSAASVFAASPRPGITGTLGIGNGGTGATTAAGVRSNLAVVGYTLVPELTGGSDFASTEYLPTAGGTMTGALRLNSTLTGTSGTFSGNLKAATVEGAVWNDYAEYRELEGLNEPGRCVVEIGNDKLAFSTGRLAPCAYIISDTFGFSIGKTETAKTPVAVAGRVLAYTYEDRNNFNIGDAVCSGPNGTISKMTRPEIMQYPERIIGIVSSIPDYEIWNDKVTINNRIWIKIK